MSNFNLFFKALAVLGCYKCTTINNDTLKDPCKDPFNPGNAPVSIYEADCKSGQYDRVGLFPARYCLKISGTRGILF